MVSHDMNTLRKQCDMGIVLNNASLTLYPILKRPSRSIKSCNHCFHTHFCHDAMSVRAMRVNCHPHFG